MSLVRITACFVVFLIRPAIDGFGPRNHSLRAAANVGEPRMKHFVAFVTEAENGFKALDTPSSLVAELIVELPDFMSFDRSIRLPADLA